MLGYHSRSRSDSVVIYGRDNLAPYLRELEEMCGAVTLGYFLPDATRSGMFSGSSRVRAEQKEQEPLSDSFSGGSEDEENRTWMRRTGPLMMWSENGSLLRDISIIWQNNGTPYMSPLKGPDYWVTWTLRVCESRKSEIGFLK